MKELQFWILYIVVFGGYLVLREVAKRNPNKLWVILLFRLSLGPRQDVKYMTRKQLFESSITFMTWGFIFLSILFAIAVVMEVSSVATVPAIALAGLFVTSILSAIAFLGAVYLFIRGVFRPRGFVPPRNDDI